MELLIVIVIVVIAILAGIAIVAYRGIQVRAQDTALKSDLSNTGRQVMAVLGDSNIGEMRDQFVRAAAGGVTSAWTLGDNSDNLVASSQLRWNNVPDLPKIAASPNSTIEIIPFYGTVTNDLTSDVNDFMLKTNNFCIAGATRGGSFNYRPMSGQRAKYDTLLFFDSTIGRVVEMKELDTADRAGRRVACEGHLKAWRTAIAP